MRQGPYREDPDDRGTVPKAFAALVPRRDEVVVHPEEEPWEA